MTKIVTLEPASSPDADRARTLAPILFLTPNEPFSLLRVVAVVHPSRPVIAYHLLWRDDVHLAWMPFGKGTDEEIVWVGHDSTGAPTDVWTYWHGRILHADWRGKGQVLIDVQWGKHGSMPRATRESSLPALQSLRAFYLLTWVLPDLWLGEAVRKGPSCFCGSYSRYRTFREPLLTSPLIDVIVTTANASSVLRDVFGGSYSAKREWPF